MPFGKTKGIRSKRRTKFDRLPGAGGCPKAIQISKTPLSRQVNTVARSYLFWKRVHEQRTQNTSSVSAGGRGSPPLHRIFWNMQIPKSQIQVAAGRHGSPPLRGGFAHQTGASSGARFAPEAGSTSAHAVPPAVQVWFPWAPWWRPEADTV